MCRFSRRILLAWLLCLAFTLNARANDFTLEPREAVLLLRTGGTLRGFVTKAGDLYLVSFGQAGQARVPASEVLRLCRDLEEAYQHKRSTIEGDYAAHLNLARWCLQERMVARASDQLLAAESLRGRQPELELLHHRLLGTTVPDKPQSDSGEVIQASAAMDAEPDLDDLPGGTLREFTTTVQPLLLNRCANGGCHGLRQTSSFFLLRSSPGRPLNRHATQRNLAATLQQLDRHSAASSQLLVLARQAHGGSETAPLLEHEHTLYETLELWARNLALKSRDAESRQDNSSSIAPASNLVWEGGIEIPSDPSRSDVPEEVDNYTPIDPFDPEVFNRRYHRQP